MARAIGDPNETRAFGTREAHVEHPQIFRETLVIDLRMRCIAQIVNRPMVRRLPGVAQRVDAAIDRFMKNAVLGHPERAHERQYHDRVLQPLRPVQRDDLDQILIALQTHEVRVIAVTVGGRDALLEPAQQPRAAAQPRRLGLQQLAGVPQVGQPPCAIRMRQPARRQTELEDRRTQHREHAPLACDLRQAVKSLRLPLPQSIVRLPCCQHHDIPATDPADQHRPHPRVVVRVDQCDQQQSHQGRRFAGENAAAIEKRRVATEPRERASHRVGLFAVAYQNGEITWRDSSTIDGVIAAQQRIDTRRGHARHRVDHRTARDHAAAVEVQVPEHEGRQIDTGAGKSSNFTIDGARDRRVVDVVEQKRLRFGAGIERVQRIRERRRGAPRHRQMMAARAADRAARVEVAENIGAAKPVDGLLRVTDQHARCGRVGTGAIDTRKYLPLQRIGVLKLVDHRHGVALAQLLCKRRTAFA